MADTEKSSTTACAKGSILQPREWRAEARLAVEETDDVVLPQPTPVFAETQSEDVFGVFPYKGKPRSITEMDAAVLNEARRRYAHD